MKKDTITLEFDSFTAARLPSGAFLFFPEWHARGKDEKQDKILFVVIKASTRLHYLQAAVVGDILHIVVDAPLFRKLGAQLREQDSGYLVKFSFEREQNGVVRDLRINGHEISPTPVCYRGKRSKR